ncbi:MAG: toll/interleukin-1 receptor domain-containing protein [Anaerolineae bacterium]
MAELTGASLDYLGTTEQAEPQADSGAVGEEATAAEDAGGKERGAMDRFASEMGQICGDKTIQVFISHATKDAQLAHRLADDLQRLGVQIWITPESIRPGEGWVEAIERGLAESSHMVVVLTPAALESEWVRKETDVAIAQERKGLIQVIPLDVEPCEVPLLLGSYQMASFRRNYDAGLSQLVDILGVRVTPPEPVRPPRQVPHQQ